MDTHQQPLSLHSPPDRVPGELPVQTVSSDLPFGGLTWENFERLCQRLASLEDDVDHAERYGRPGQAQGGIDIYARKKNGRYDCWQAKRYARFMPRDLDDAVATFLAGEWAARTDVLTIAVQASVAETRLQQAIERQAAALHEQGIELRVLGAEALAALLRSHLQLVLDFFGRPWAKVFFGDHAEVAAPALEAVDGAEMARVRRQLHSVYKAQFDLLDPVAIDGGEPNDPRLHRDIGFLSRFIRPDLLVGDLPDAWSEAAAAPGNPVSTPGADRGGARPRDAQRQGGVAKMERLRRAPLTAWLSQADQLALLGEAGTGKSTVLRGLALDLLGDQSSMPEIAPRWGKLLPLYISFGRWTRLTATGGSAGIKDVLRMWPQPLIAADLIGIIDRAIDERRVLLLIDGLDEWTDEQAARTALQTLFAFVNAHQIPTVVSARPRGLERIGKIPMTWVIGTLAPLSPHQQRQLVLRRLGALIDERREDTGTLDPVVQQAADRFFRELKSSQGVAALAEIALLLVSLLTLSVHRITLPKKRVQVMEQLVDVLLEVHPQARATEAGAVHARFRHITDPDMRKGALAALAHALRVAGADAGFPIAEAKKAIRAYLSAPETHALTPEQAVKAANELLHVNAETVGLLVEKAPGEIGFVHASLEEYLSACHIQAWPLEKVTRLVGENATDPRWRNVIANLVAISSRAEEIDKLIRSINEAPADFFGKSIKRQLLADIAFAPSRMSPASAIRLGKATIAALEASGPLRERRALLASAMSGLYHPVLGAVLKTKIGDWAPKPLFYGRAILPALGNWAPDPALQAALLGALRDESLEIAREAAQALAKVYGGDRALERVLREMLNGTTNMPTAAATLEALVRGWPAAHGLQAMVEDAVVSRFPMLQAVGIWAAVRLKLGLHIDSVRILSLLDGRGRLGFWEKPLAEEALAEGWANDPQVIGQCIHALRSEFSLHNAAAVDRQVAVGYLLRCSTDDVRIRDWIRHELHDRAPFSHLYIDGGIGIGRFIAASRPIAAAAAARIRSHFEEGQLHVSAAHMIRFLDDPRVKTLACRAVLDARFETRATVLESLLERWPDDDAVQALLAALRALPDAQLHDFRFLLAHIVPDAADGRRRLLSMYRGGTEREHLWGYARAFAAAGCDEHDEEVVAALLERVPASGRDAEADELVLHFGAHPLVEAAALATFTEYGIPTAAIATRYGGKADVRAALLRQISVLPASLRYVVAEAAGIDTENTEALLNLLSRYRIEDDEDLQIFLSIRHHEIMHAEGRAGPEHVDHLLRNTLVGRSVNEGEREAAVAGLIVLGQIDKMADLSEFGKPLPIPIGQYGHESGILLELIARKWDRLRAAFGTGLLDRIAAGHSAEYVWKHLAPYTAWNARLRQEFLAYCGATRNLASVEILNALVREPEYGKLLERHCVAIVRESLDQPAGPPDCWRLCRAAFILRDYFGTQDALYQELAAALVEHGQAKVAMVLAIYAPKAPVFASTRNKLWRPDQDDFMSALSCMIAANAADSAYFVEVLRAMIKRPHNNMYYFQPYMNMLVNERLAADDAAAQLLTDAVQGPLTHDEAASLPRYISAARALDADTEARVRQLLTEYARRRGIVPTGYDALEDAVRPVSHALFDALR